jgi:hypothetical protein
MWRPDLSDLKRTRRSTWILLLLFAGVFVLYLWVRPAPTVAPRENTGNQQHTQRTSTPSRPRTHSSSPSHSRTPTRSTKTPTPTKTRPTPTGTSITSPGSTLTTTPAPGTASVPGTSSSP